MKINCFFKNMGAGALMGVAMIIPGVSGGTIAVLLNVYDKLINAISDLRRDFKRSFALLFPVALGAVLAVAAMYFPLKYALDRAPLPTVLLFVGLMAGSCPKIFKDGLQKGFKPAYIAAAVLPLAAVIGICFIPSLGEANLGTDMPYYGYPLLALMGILASCALVVPGVSGSMLMLIFGYYAPILGTVSALFTSFGHSLAVLACFAAGLLIGFFSIAKLMKFFLKKFPGGTLWAIIGFVAGSIPAIFITFRGNFPNAPLDTAHIAVGVVLCLLGAVLSYALTAYMEAKSKKTPDSRA